MNIDIKMEKEKQEIIEAKFKKIDKILNKRFKEISKREFKYYKNRKPVLVK